MTGKAARTTRRRASIEEAPADALAFLSASATDRESPAQTSALAPLANLLGIRVDQLLADIEGEAALLGPAGAPASPR